MGADSHEYVLLSPRSYQWLESVVVLWLGRLPSHMANWAHELRGYWLALGTRTSWGD